MTRLINADALIEDLEYDVELDARELDDTDLSLGRNRELVQFDKDCKQNMVDILKNAPTVDAVPIEWIEEFIQGIIQTRDKQIQDISKWRHFDDNIVVLVALLDSWKEEQKNEHSEEGSEVQ